MSSLQYFFLYFFHKQANTPACSCIDCEASCPKPEPPKPTPVPFSIGGLDGYAVVMLIVFVVGTFLFLVGVCMSSRKSMGKFFLVFTTI